jgi:hypothetical protein
MNQGQKVLEYINDILARIRNSLECRPCGNLSITLDRITGYKPQYTTSDQCPVYTIESSTVTYTFPGKTKDEAWRFGG